MSRWQDVVGEDRGTSTRERIIDAAAELMRTLGLARTTTREIARAAGFSEATLYKHFADKEDLFLQVLHHRLPPLGELLTALPDRAGTGTVDEHLVAVVRRAIDFYAETMPIGASLFSEPTLLARHRERLAGEGAGPRNPYLRLAEYLAAEQRLGRVAAGVDPSAAAALLLGAAFQQAFLARFHDVTPPTGPEPAGSLVATILAGLAP